MTNTYKVRDSVVLREEVDVVALRKIILNFDKFDIRIKNQRGEKLDKDATLTILKEYYFKKVKDDNVEYHYTGGYRGRLISKGPSLQGVSRKVRHTIAKERYIDIDVKNCHPVVLLKICDDYGIDASSVKYYVDNREECLAEIVKIFGWSRDEAKQRMLAIMNGEAPSKILNGHIIEERPEWLVNYIRDIPEIMGYISDKHPKLYELTKKKKEFNVEFSTANKVLLIWENKILNVMIDVFEANEVEVGALCFDGLLIYSDKELEYDGVLKGILRDAEKAVKKTLNISIQLEVKPMDQSLDLTGFEDGKLTHPLDVKMSELIISEWKKEGVDVKQAHVRKYLLEDISCEGNVVDFYVEYFMGRIWGDYVAEDRMECYILDEKTNVYQKNYKKPIASYVAELFEPYTVGMNKYYENKFKQLRGDDWDEGWIPSETENKLKVAQKKRNVFKKSSVVYAITDAILNDRRQRALYNFSRINKNPGIICFDCGSVVEVVKEDGVFREIKIRPARKEDVIVKTTGYSLAERNEDDVKFVERVLRSFMTSEALADSFLTVLSQCLWGVNELRKLVALMGVGKNGKSVTMEFITDALGDNYATQLSSDALSAKGSVGSATTELNLAVGKFVAFISEPEIANAEKVKKITSKHDKLQIRNLFEAAQNLSVNCNMFICTNNTLKFDKEDSALRDRLLYIPFKKRFVPEEDMSLVWGPHLKEADYLKMRKHNEVVLERVERYKKDGIILEKADHSLSEKLKCPRYWSAFIHLMIDVYRRNRGEFVSCSEISEFTLEKIAESNELQSYITERYEAVFSVKDGIGLMTLKEQINAEIMTKFTKEEVRSALVELGFNIEKGRGNVYTALVKYKSAPVNSGNDNPVAVDDVNAVRILM